MMSLFTKQENPFVTPMNDIKHHHLHGIQYLWNSFKNKNHGAILNQQTKMNMQLQVCVFLKRISEEDDFESNFSNILIVCPDDSTLVWHYHLITHAGWKNTRIVSTNEFDIENEPQTAYIVSLGNVKFLEIFHDTEFFIVIVDRLDTVATKLFLRKLDSTFNIGLTERDFIRYPDPRVKWFMLNWTNPGCVGKLAEFYEIDTLNVRNFVDAYKHWWLRLTWKFCETFQRPSDEEIRSYNDILKKWLENYEIEINVPMRKKRSSKTDLGSEQPLKRKKESEDYLEEITDEITESIVEDEVQKTNSQNLEVKSEEKEEDNEDCPNEQSNETVDMENEDFILTSIMKNSHAEKFDENLQDSNEYSAETETKLDDSDIFDSLVKDSGKNQSELDENSRNSGDFFDTFVKN